MSTRLQCESKTCKTFAPELFQAGNLFVCAPCVPDDVWRRYDKWKEKKAQAVREFKTSAGRAELAKKNLAKKK